MRLDAMVVGGVVLIVAVVALVVVWIQRSELTDSDVVQGLGGPQPTASPAPAAPVPIAAAAPLEPAPPSAIVVYFDFDGAELPPAESAKLARMLDGAFKRIDAVGHADRIGPASYNLRLSQRRAESVRDYLVRHKVDAAIVHTSAKGEVEPVSGDACVDMGPQTRANRGLVECLQPDRRVEVTFIRGL